MGVRTSHVVETDPAEIGLLVERQRFKASAAKIRFAADPSFALVIFHVNGFVVRIRVNRAQRTAKSPIALSSPLHIGTLFFSQKLVSILPYDSCDPIPARALPLSIHALHFYYFTAMGCFTTFTLYSNNPCMFFAVVNR